jgi:hypothetical protein
MRMKFSRPLPSHLCPVQWLCPLLQSKPARDTKPKPGPTGDPLPDVDPQPGEDGGGTVDPTRDPPGGVPSGA